MCGQKFSYSGHYRCVGAAFLWLSFGFGLMSGLFCFAFKPAINDEPLIRVLTAVGFAGCGALFFRVGVRYLFGHLVVDNEGARIWPPGFGFSFQWGDLERWKVKTIDMGDEGEAVVLEMILLAAWCPRRWAATFTSKVDFCRLVGAMRRLAPDRESNDFA